MNPLGQETGGDENARLSEAHRLVDMITSVQDRLGPKEARFVEDMRDCTTCSGRQLFWLRDIKDKYL